MQIAVVGGGIAGLTSAWLLSSKHDVTLYEQAPTPGMGAHAVSLPSLKEGLPPLEVDVPLRVVFKGYYPNLFKLYSKLGVALDPITFSGSFTDATGKTYFRYGNLKLGDASMPFSSLFALEDPRGRAILWDLFMFYVSLPREGSSRQTLGEYCAERGFSAAFVEGFLLPVFASIGTCSVDAIRSYPVRTIINYMTSGVFSQSLFRTRNGTGEVVNRLAEPISKLRCGSRVRRVEAKGDKIVVEDHSDALSYDHVIVATEANQAVKFVKSAPNAVELLKKIRYERTETVIHTDTLLAPPRYDAWAPVNYMFDDRGEASMATIWLNSLMPSLRHQRPIFQTWNPLVQPREKHHLGSVTLARPIVDAESLKTVDALAALQNQGSRRIWFVGSYAARGVPLLESGVTSALKLAKHFEIPPPLL